VKIGTSGKQYDLFHRQLDIATGMKVSKRRKKR
jgi:hypothetical protein